MKTTNKKQQESLSDKCCECGKKFKKGEEIISRYDNPKLWMHLNIKNCKSSEGN